MILTPAFVFIHQPKTGGSFVTAVLEELLGPPESAVRPGASIVNINKHGTCREIPDSHLHLPIVSVVRNPFERYVSQYEFGWWRHELPPWVDMVAVRTRLPSYPDLGFEDFVTGSDILLQRFRQDGISPDERLGLQSEQFVRFFFREPERFETMDQDYIDSGGYRNDAFPVTFLRAHRLNHDLVELLRHAGFAVDRLRPVLERARVRPPGHPRQPVSSDWSTSRGWRDYYSPALLRLVERRERLLLRMFPEFARP